MSKSRKRRQLARKLSRAQSLRALSARSLRYEALEDRRMLAVVTVTTDQDVVDFSDGVTSLREAIFATNLVEGADEIRFDFGHDGPATILLTKGELAIKDSLTITGSGAELLTIDASGNDPTPDVNNGDGSRIFNIDDGDLSNDIVTVDVFISGVTLTGGDLGGDRGGGPASGQGGAIFSLENLSLLGVTVTANAANHDGGGVFTKGVTTITDSTFSLNQSASFSGGGLFVQDTTLVVTGSTFRENTSFRDGGGLFALDTTSTITSSTFSGNTAEKLNGGGIWVKGEVLIADSTVSGNSATRGGGIFAFQADPTILGSTISGNASLRSGGGIWANLNSGVIKVTHSTISGNIADSRSSGRGQGGGLYLQDGFVILNHSLVTGNHDALGSPDLAAYVSSSYSLIGTGAEFLGPLADNGGPTLTHALLPGSPAINAGDLNAVAGEDGVPLFDQRGDGFDRILSRIDIGAYEVQELGDLNLLVDTLVDESDGDFSRGDLSLREAIELANANPVPDTIRFDPIFAAIAGPLPATILLTMGELAITDSVEIVGLGAGLLTIDASGNDRTPSVVDRLGSSVFLVTDDNSTSIQQIVISGLTLTGGDSFLGGGISNFEDLTLTDMTLEHNDGFRGGGIYVGSGTLQMYSSTIKNNNAVDGGGVYVKDGGAEINNSTISNNVAAGSGGGIYLERGDLEVHSTSISKNLARFGGGIRASAVTHTLIDQSMINENHALSNGGGVMGVAFFDIKPHIEITQTTISRNVARAELYGDYGGGGIYLRGANLILRDSLIADNHSNIAGGGIVSRRASTMQLTNSTISGNSSYGHGGGIFSEGVFEITHSTITNNLTDSNENNTGLGGGVFSRGSGLIDHTIIFGNKNGPERVSDDFHSRFGSENQFTSSLIGTINPLRSRNPTWQADAATLIGVDPLLGPLANNGGPTLTHALLPGSPAINAGDLNAVAGEDGVPLFDQRGDGFDRILSRIDIGAYEVQELGDLNLLVDTLVDESDGDFSRGDLSLREAIELANANPVPDTIRFDPIFAAIAGPLPATILLTQGELAITDSVEIVGLGAELLTIDASGNDPTPDENDGNGSRVFNINDNDDTNHRNVSIEGLTLTGGDITGGSNTGGGAILSFESLTVRSSTVTGNSSFAGGGISVIGVGDSVSTISSSTIANNIARSEFTSTRGGGVFFRLRDSSELAITSSILSGNSSSDGGGLHGGAADSSRATLDSNTFTDNLAESGGGLRIGTGGDATMTITSSTITGNSTAGLYGRPPIGAGIHAQSSENSTLTITANIITENSSYYGGGAYLWTSGSSTLILDSNTISRNSSYRSGGIDALVTGPALLTITSNQITDNVGSGITATGIEQGLLKIANNTISRNSARQGAGIYGGGALLIESNEISDNHAREIGGGIRIDADRASSVTIRSNTIVGNSAVESGGGIFFSARDWSDSSIVSSTISENTAGVGGGLFLSAGDRGVLTISSSTISENAATDGGGVYVTTNTRGDIHFDSNTISGNSAERNGGGIYARPYSSIPLAIEHTTITNNTADSDSDNEGIVGGLFASGSPIELSHSIVAGNIDHSGAVPDIAGIINSNFSLIGFGAEFLGPLADNGGPTLTHALLPGSPAINAGDPLADGIPDFDQRGNPFTRISGGRIDIGAYESQPIPGDFDGDGDSDRDDLNFWESDYGSTESGLNPTDSDADGDTDGTDFLNWQRTFSVVLSEAVSVSAAVERSSAAAGKKESVLRTEAVDLAFVMDPLILIQPNDQQSTLETELAIDFVLLPVPEAARPVHRGTVRSAYRLVESAASDKDLHAELEDELSALDELFAQV